MKRDSGDDTRDRAGRTGSRDWWQDLRHQHIDESTRSEANRNLHLLLPGNIPVLWQDQGSQPLLTPSMFMVSPRGTLKASPGCPGTPPPYLSSDSLFCVEEEEETVEDLESAEALLAGQAPCQRAAAGTSDGSTPQAQPSEGPGSCFSHPHAAQYPPLFLATQRRFLGGRSGAPAITGLSSPRPKGRERSSQQTQHTLATCELDPVHLHPPSLSTPRLPAKPPLGWQCLAEPGVRVRASFSRYLCGLESAEWPWVVVA